MHPTSMLKARAFHETYVDRVARSVRVLDVGAKVYGGAPCHADIFRKKGIDYVGLDLEEGPNVDFVPKSPYVWDELENESFDFCLSGQTYEHNPYFWVTTAEIARVLKPGGYVFLVAPGRGEVHRYPLDCWRFFPDAWTALCSYVGLGVS